MSRRRESFIMVLSGSVPGWPAVALFRCLPGTRWRTVLAATMRTVRAANGGKAVSWRDVFIEPAPSDAERYFGDGRDGTPSDAELLEGQRTFFARTKVAERWEIAPNGAVRKLPPVT